MRHLLLFLALFLAASESFADPNAILRVRQYNNGLTTITLGGNWQDTILQFLDDKSSGQLKCGTPAGEVDIICQIHLDARGRPLFDFEVGDPSSRIDEVIYSDTSGSDAYINRDEGYLIISVTSEGQSNRLLQFPDFRYCTPPQMTYGGMFPAQCSITVDRLGRIL